MSSMRDLFRELRLQEKLEDTEKFPGLIRGETSQSKGKGYPVDLMTAACWFESTGELDRQVRDDPSSSPHDIHDILYSKNETSDETYATFVWSEVLKGLVCVSVHSTSLLPANFVKARRLLGDDSILTYG